MHYRVAFKGHYFAEYRVSGSERIIRGISVARNDISGLGHTAFPAALLSGTGPMLVRVFVAANLSEDDQLTGCRIGSAIRFTKGGATGFAVRPDFETEVCGLVRSRLAFHHGLFDDGRRLGGPLQITLEFTRWSGSAEPDLLPPMLSVAAPRFWAPNKLPGPELTFSEPEWEKFLPPLGSLPLPLSVGVEVRVTKAGTIDYCGPVGYSEVRAFDGGVCDALLSQARTGPVDKDQWYYPILVRWDGVSVRMVRPQPSQPPRLAGVLRIPSDIAAPLPLPADPMVDASIIVAKDGKTGRCRIDDSVMDDRLGVLTCGMLMRPGFFKPGADIFGDPSPWRLHVKVDWRAGSMIVAESH
jgi:hypothetical protein